MTPEECVKEDLARILLQEKEFIADDTHAKELAEQIGSGKIGVPINLKGAENKPLLDHQVVTEKAVKLAKVYSDTNNPQIVDIQKMTHGEFNRMINLFSYIRAADRIVYVVKVSGSFLGRSKIRKLFAIILLEVDAIDGLILCTHFIEPK